MSVKISRRRGLAVGVAAAATVATFAGAGAGYAATSGEAATVQPAAAATVPAIQTITPRSEKDITNIDVLRQQVKNYYGDSIGTGQFSLSSNYAKEAREVAAEGARYLESKRVTGQAPRVVVLDVDSTLLSDYSLEIQTNFGFSADLSAEFVQEQKGIPVPGMLSLVKAAEREGYTVVYLTGRASSQEPATLGNLTADGIGVDADYPKPATLNNGEDGLFTKPDVADYPDYLKKACAGDPDGKCTTIDYKSATRKHIESLGYDIVANFGDQLSDLKGGFAVKTFKLPNPTYYLP